MGIKLTWLPNPDSDVKEYEVHRSTDNTTFTKIATVTHDLADVLVYDSSLGRFFYLDATGLTTHYYRIRAADVADNKSAYTISKQSGPPLPDICVLHGYVVKADATAEPEAQVIVTPQSAKTTKAGQYVSTYGLTSEQIEVFTDDVGYWEVNVVRTATVVVEIPKINLKATVTIPNLASAEITTLI